MEATPSIFGVVPPSDHSKNWSMGVLTTPKTGAGERARIGRSANAGAGSGLTVESAGAPSHTPKTVVLSMLPVLWQLSGLFRPLRTEGKQQAARVRFHCDDERAMLNIGPGPANCVNESGLFSLVHSSRKPEARRFKKWVTSEAPPDTAVRTADQAMFAAMRPGKNGDLRFLASVGLSQPASHVR